ncbi:hypothetical protein [Pleionea sediminis]|uniref:hypothetical protein n=1 Tax=Pleionea sediminis TaxID=2569479 RepID=UPI00118488D4|nr:hypothetical protein [Pleionea sediminis]
MNKILFIVMVFLSLNLSAKKPCDSEEYKQFDFWVGTWDVYSRDGKKVGVNRISKELGGCILKEHYTTDKGFEGKSFNIFDVNHNTWHQTWVDNSGTLLKLDGKWNGTVMTLKGEGKNKEGKKVIHRIEWKPKKNGDVHQVWDSSIDKGLHWSSVFYGVYQKQKQ